VLSVLRVARAMMRVRARLNMRNRQRHTGSEGHLEVE
jgi:hypothetical protein